MLPPFVETCLSELQVQSEQPIMVSSLRRQLDRAQADVARLRLQVR